MERLEIKKLSEKKLNINNLDEIKKNYEISFGNYEKSELKKAIKKENPFFIKNNFIIGYDPTDDKFWNDRNEKISIEKMVKAVIIEDKIDATTNKTGDYFAIVGKNTWESIQEFKTILGNLRVGEIFLPSHSAIFNFLRPSEKQIKEKIVSCLEGVNINIYSMEDYVDNAIHEIGHLFWRTCLTFDEKQKFVNHHKHLKPSAIYAYEWEKSDEQEVFATIYKWYVKSMLMNPSFYNILQYEDPEGLALIQAVMDRKSKDRLVNDIWEMNKDKVEKFLNVPFDKTTGKRIVKTGVFESIKDIELPETVLNDVETFQDGIMFVKLNKAVLPVKDNKIDWANMKKAKQIK